MSKIEAGRMKLDLEPLDLSKTLVESLRVVSGRAEDKNLVIDADIAGTISVVADRRAVKQIVVNLLSNAVKFTPDGGKVVDFTALESRLTTICLTARRSATTEMVPAISASITRFLSSARPDTTRSDSASVLDRSSASRSSFIRPASIFDMSRMSLITSSR